MCGPGAVAGTGAGVSAAEGARRRWAVGVARWLLPVLLAACSVVPAAAAAPQVPEVISAEWIKRYLSEVYEPEAVRQCNKFKTAQWTYETNITKENDVAYQNAKLEYAAFAKNQWDNYFSRVNSSDLDEELMNRLGYLRNLVDPLETDDAKELTATITNMSNTFSTAKICPYQRDTCEGEEMLNLDPSLEEIMASSRNYNELLYVWKAWQNASGKQIRDTYKKYVILKNKEARLMGAADYGEVWRIPYNSDNFQDELRKLWESIEPLYVELHKYVRTKLKLHYGDQMDISDDLLPAHVLGDMHASTWIKIFDLVKPFPEGSDINITQSLIDQEYDVLQMFKTANDFYMSLGLENCSMSYDDDAMIVRPEGREVVCHPSAWDFCDGRDFRIKMCTKINMEDFLAIHHEMGHIQYYIQVKDLREEFRNSANPGFHEAMGDVISLSVTSAKHLKKLGLLTNDYEDTYENDINFLMKTALDKVPSLPFALVVDYWRWNVFSGLSSDHWNKEWWQLREQIQRIKPPVSRTEDDFDPGALYHVADDGEYMAYFIANILEFQFHKSLCEAAGQYEPKDYKLNPLYKCDIFHSKAAGDRLRKGMMMGSSTDWRDVLEVITGQREYSVDAILEYFRPLHEFLVTENACESGSRRNELQSED
ncbi:Angiotensin-converting enzyme [Gryllus bimaculatus]|nr:Angiotensin-converting enzyme [Gryllus bimaculatus]